MLLKVEIQSVAQDTFERYAFTLRKFAVLLCCVSRSYIWLSIHMQ